MALKITETLNKEDYMQSKQQKDDKKSLEESPALKAALELMKSKNQKILQKSIDEMNTNMINILKNNHHEL